MKKKNWSASFKFLNSVVIAQGTGDSKRWMENVYRDRNISFLVFFFSFLLLRTSLLNGFCFYFFIFLLLLRRPNRLSLDIHRILFFIFSLYFFEEFQQIIKKLKLNYVHSKRFLGGSFSCILLVLQAFLHEIT